MPQEMHAVVQPSWPSGLLAYQPFMGFGRSLCAHTPGSFQRKGRMSVKGEREEDGVLPSDRLISKSKLVQRK